MDKIKIFFKEIVFKDFSKKLLAVTIAFIVWLLLINIDNPVISKTFTVPVSIINEESLTSLNKVYQVLDGKQTTVKISGKRSYVEKLSNSDIEATADMSKLSITNAIPIEVKSLKNNELLDKQITGTNTVLITLEDYITKSFPVNIVTTGNLANGLYVNSIKKDISQITVSGAQSIITRVSDIKGTIDISNNLTDFSKTIKISPYDNSGTVIKTGLKLSIDEVTASVEILKTKQLPIEIVQTGSLGSGYKIKNIELSNNLVTVAGNLENLNKITSITKEIDISSFTENKSIKVDIEELLPEGVILITEGEEETTVNIEVEKYLTKEISLEKEDIEIVDLSSDLTSEIETNNISFVINGLEEDVENLDVIKLNPHINLSDLTKGIHEVELLFNDETPVTIEKTVNLEVEIKEK